METEVAKKLFTVEEYHRMGEAGIFHPEARRSEEHTSELQSPCNLVCRLLLEKKKIISERADFVPYSVQQHGGLFWWLVGRFRSAIGPIVGRSVRSTSPPGSAGLAARPTAGRA